MSSKSWGNCHKYEYLTGEDILPPNQQQIIEQARFTYSPLGKAFEKQTKTIDDQGQKQVDALNTLKSNNQLTIEDAIPKNALINDETKKELDKIKEIDKNLDREKLIYETNEYIDSFKNFQTRKEFGRDIYEGKITLEKGDQYQTDLWTEIMNFRKNTKPWSQEKDKKKKLFLITCIIFLKADRKFLMLLKAKYFWQNLRVEAF